MKVNFNKITLNHEKLRRCSVGALIVFDSYVEGTFHPGSDIDIGVVFEDLNPLKTNPVEVYGLLYEELTEKIALLSN